MAAPGRSDAANEPKGLSNRREREFLRYAEVVFGMSGWESSDKARSSDDVSLTAFAQLVALRLNAKRVLISLYDKSKQYFLTEATRTLSLQHDSVHDEGDALFWGRAILPRRQGLNILALEAKHGTAAVIPNLLDHERYASHPHVLGAPHIRSYAGVPMISPNNFPFGTVTILDDKPRPEGLNPREVAFMHDVAATIVSHLELARTKAVYHRGIKMVKGLSQFMEGKFPKGHTKKSGSHVKISGKRKRAEAVELSDSDENPPLHMAGNAELVHRSTRKRRDGAETPKRDFSSPGSALSAIQVGRDSPQSRPVARGSKLGKIDGLDSLQGSTDSETVTTKFNDDVVSKDISHAFERAAKIIQQTMDMAGVLFLHASVGALGNLRPPTGNSPEGSEAGASTTAGSDDALSLDEGSNKKRITEMKMCSPLAAAYNPKEGESADISSLTVSERFLKSLMQRFPYGKIWNFSDDELLSSDEHSDSSVAFDLINAGESAPSIHGRSKRLWTDHEKILESFPGVRSFGIMPMWDSRSKRFFAGAIVWSYNTSRIFSMTDEVNYLGAFCDVVMAEVGRLDVQADVKAQTTFISSISHELRSPLHGILGGVECLQELPDPSNGRQMLQMIDTCGRSLLDIINNLLDHAQAAAASESNVRKYGAKRRKRRLGYQLTPLESVNDIAILTEEVLDSALWSTPEPAPQSKTPNVQDVTAPSSDEPLKVVLEIDSTNLPPGGWNFHVNAGAWRRILQNLTTNAIKYTDRGGYFKVTLSISNTVSDGASPTSTVELTCTDSGRGMSKSFLDRGLWKEFQQEESNVQGTGLGLSLVRSLVEDMGGTIQVRSSKGIGTAIKMSVPLAQGVAAIQQPEEIIDPGPLRGLRFGIIGLENDMDGHGRTAEATRIFRSAILRSCHELGMHHHGAGADAGADPDVYIISEKEAASAMEMEEPALPRHSFQRKPCIVLCNSARSSRAFTSHGSGWLTRATIVAQPLGPRKFVAALLSCIGKFRTGSPVAEMQPPPSGTTKHDVRIALKQKFEDVTPTVLNPSETLPRGPVLLVDDNPVNLSLLQKSMEKLGRLQISATNGLEAVEAYQKSLAKRAREAAAGAEDDEASRPPSPPVTIIFMDITMPVMDGLESTRRIRAYERSLKLRPAKIAALTALASPRARQEAFGSGIDLFLTKPIRFKEIQGILEEWDRNFTE